MPNALHSRRVLPALASAAAVGLLMCTTPKPDEDERLPEQSPPPPSSACLGSECADASPNAGGPRPPETGPLEVGAPGCAVREDCNEGVCLPDVDGALRCCAADCQSQGRVCSTT